MIKPSTINFFYVWNTKKLFCLINKNYVNSIEELGESVYLEVSFDYKDFSLYECYRLY